MLQEVLPHILVALMGLVQFDSGRNVRLPLELADHILRHMKGRLTRCDKCRCRLLSFHTGILFSRHIITEWQLKGHMLVANRESTLLHSVVPYARDLPERCWIVTGKKGKALLYRSADYIAVLRKGTFMVFENAWFRMEQHAWYKACMPECGRERCSFVCNDCHRPLNEHAQRITYFS